MKKNIILLLLAITQTSLSQNKTVSVEKSIYGIQTGLLGFWAHNESRISNEISFRTELGLDFGFSTGGLSNENVTAFIPNIRLEPRWYYNLDKRNSKGKNIKKNSANFLAINFNYNPDWFFISNTNSDRIKVINVIGIIPKWGIKRTYGKHFTFETGFGIGPLLYLEEYVGIKNNVGVDLHLRMGYTF